MTLATPLYLTAHEAEALVLSHLELVQQIAGRMAKRLPANILMEEIVGHGQLGLIQAAIRFDPNRHASFAAWATWRIRGAIIDAYRGRNYPRRFVQLIQAEEEDTTCPLEHRGYPAPNELIDPAPSIEAVLIEEQETLRVITRAVEAHEQLPEKERQVFTLHAGGKSMRRIGRENAGKSAAWAHYTIHSARRKMLAQLKNLDKAA